MQYIKFTMLYTLSCNYC